MGKRTHGFAILVRQLNNPLLLILSVATVLSFWFGEGFNAVVIFSMILVSVVLGFWNEYRAEKTVDDLLNKIPLTTMIVRDGDKQSIPVSELVLGDEVILYPGAIVPADLELDQTRFLHIDESVLTGESIPVHKSGRVEAYMGTVVISGTGMGKVRKLGNETKFGKISQSVVNPRPETEFQKGLTRFGKMLLRVILAIAVAIFVINWILGRPVFNSALFALTVAIGLTPEFLPVIVTVSLSHGARQLSKKKVIVKQLVAIEDLGNMEILCCDKTGTLTEGKLKVAQVDLNTLSLALICNSATVHHKVLGDPIDVALWEYAKYVNFEPEQTEKVLDQPFDYGQRGMFSVIEAKGKRKYIFKGAPDKILEICDLGKDKEVEQKKIGDWYKQGYRIVGVATKEVKKSERYTFSDAKAMKFVGWILFSDPPKLDAKKALDRFEEMGVKLKIVTGDNELVTSRVCEEIDMPHRKIMTGDEIEKISDQELAGKVMDVDVFARMTPELKLRVIRALKVGGVTVGYMGDGINDSPALHEADAGISVDTAVDVAKDAASVVLLSKSLEVIADAILEGRRTFANTNKYILMGTSSNFGNMVSMAGASFFLPFLPMAPTQILLANALYDMSQLSIPTDNVDAEQLVKPKGWNIAMIKRHMAFFGPISSIYDFLTFGIMYFGFSARDQLFQTGWFVESLVTQIFVIFVIRTARPFWKSRPGILVSMVSIGVVLFGATLPYWSLGKTFEMVPLPWTYMLAIVGLTATYLFVVEWGKRRVGLFESAR